LRRAHEIRNLRRRDYRFRKTECAPAEKHLEKENHDQCRGTKKKVGGLRGEGHMRKRKRSASSRVHLRRECAKKCDDRGAKKKRKKGKGPRALKFDVEVSKALGIIHDAALNGAQSSQCQRNSRLRQTRMEQGKRTGS